MKDEITKRIFRVRINTHTLRRRNSILDVSNDIIWLAERLGSLKEVSKRVGVTAGMLSRFLSVLRLNPEVKELVRKRKIDSVSVVDFLKVFDPKAQLVIANEYINGEISFEDIKILVPFSRKFDKEDLKSLIKRIKDSKDKRSFVFFFFIPADTDRKKIERDFKNIVGESYIVKSDFERAIGYLEVSEKGLKQLRNHARKTKQNLKVFINNMVEKYKIGE